MPEISRFYGIVIMMFAKDHIPPHFHARYGEYEALFAIEDGKVIEGKFPRRATKLVEEWVGLYKNELLENYQESQKPTPRFHKIPPLD